MKRILVVLLSLMILSLSSLTAFASDVQVTVDGQAVEFADQKPYINETERTVVPIRAPMEALGAAIDWDEANQQVIVEKDGVAVVFTIGSATYTVNGTAYEMDTPAVITGDRTCIPIRYAVEALGATLVWDGETNTVAITVEAAEDAEAVVDENAEEENVVDEEAIDENAEEEVETEDAENADTVEEDADPGEGAEDTEDAEAVEDGEATE